VWRGVAETPVAFHVYSMNLLGPPFDPAVGRTFYKPEVSPAIQAVANTTEFRIFAQFAQYPLWQAMPSAEVEHGTQVDLLDMRFPFHCRAIVDGENRVRRTECPVHDR
jgi:hypothetical protein